jgi:uracil-DNA glycosylase family 4
MSFLFQQPQGARQPLPTLLPRCGECGLLKGCKSKNMPPSGRGEKKIFILAEAPGRDEDRLGKQLVGVTGSMLEEILAELGVDMRRDCILHNSIACRPPDNRTPTDKEITYCRPNLLNALREHKPEKIILLGGPAVKSLIRYLWSGDVNAKAGKGRKGDMAITKWAGWQIPSQKLNAWVCPTFHPSFVMRQERENRNNTVTRLWFKRHLKTALALEGRPWPGGFPDYRTKVDIIFGPSAAAYVIDAFRDSGKPVAFDFETNMLKPDSKDSRIVCCSVSDGSQTIAYPWQGEAVKATKRLLYSDVPKIGYSEKFEDRWAEAIFGKFVRGWKHDGMLTAHLLDPRNGVTSLEFQAFALFGIDNWKAPMKKYLEAKEKGGYSQNRVRDAPKRELFLYSGMDSLFEWMVWDHQAKKLKGGKR